jgi:hypothetical protein
MFASVCVCACVRDLHQRVDVAVDDEVIFVSDSGNTATASDGTTPSKRRSKRGSRSQKRGHARSTSSPSRSSSSCSSSRGHSRSRSKHRHASHHATQSDSASTVTMDTVTQAQHDVNKIMHAIRVEKVLLRMDWQRIVQLCSLLSHFCFHS